VISVLIGLLSLLPEATIYSATFAPTPRLAEVVVNRQWDNTEYFDVLVGLPNCAYLADWVWIIGPDGVRSGVVVDCARDEHRAQMIADGIVDVSEGGGQGWVVIIRE